MQTEKSGKVIEINNRFRSGIIQDRQGKKYVFSIFACLAQELPPLNATVLFVKDPDFKENVALTVRICHLQTVA